MFYVIMIESREGCYQRALSCARRVSFASAFESFVRELCSVYITEKGINNAFKYVDRI